MRAFSEGPGKGATFTIQLPTADGDDLKAREVVPDAAADSATIHPLLRGRMVLIVEDDDDARELVAAVLQDAGARVVGAASSQDAMELIANM